MKSILMTRARVAGEVLTAIRDNAGLRRKMLHRWAVEAGGQTLVVRCECPRHARFIALTAGMTGPVVVRPTEGGDE